MRSVGSGAALAVHFIPLSLPLLCFILFSFFPSSGMKQLGQAVLPFQGESKLGAGTFFFS